MVTSEETKVFQMFAETDNNEANDYDPVSPQHSNTDAVIAIKKKDGIPLSSYEKEYENMQIRALEALVLCSPIGEPNSIESSANAEPDEPTIKLVNNQFEVVYVAISKIKEFKGSIYEDLYKRQQAVKDGIKEEDVLTPKLEIPIDDPALAKTPELEILDEMSEMLKSSANVERNDFLEPDSPDSEESASKKQRTEEQAMKDEESSDAEEEEEEDDVEEVERDDLAHQVHYDNRDEPARTTYSQHYNDQFRKQPRAVVITIDIHNCKGCGKALTSEWFQCHVCGLVQEERCSEYLKEKFEGWKYTNGEKTVTIKFKQLKHGGMLQSEKVHESKLFRDSAKLLVKCRFGSYKKMYYYCVDNAPPLPETTPLYPGNVEARRHNIECRLWLASECFKGIVDKMIGTYCHNEGRWVMNKEDVFNGILRRANGQPVDPVTLETLQITSSYKGSGGGVMSKEERMRRYPDTYGFVTDQNGGSRTITKREILEALGYSRENVKQAMQRALTPKQIVLMFGMTQALAAGVSLTNVEPNSDRSRTPQGTERRFTRSQPPKASAVGPPVPRRAIEVRRNRESLPSGEHSPRGRPNQRERGDRQGHERRPSPYTDDRQAARDRRRYEEEEKEARRRGYNSHRQRVAAEEAESKLVAENRRITDPNSQQRDNWYHKDQEDRRRERNPVTLHSGPDSKTKYRYTQNQSGGVETRSEPKYSTKDWYCQACGDKMHHSQMVCGWCKGDRLAVSNEYGNENAVKGQKAYPQSSSSSSTDRRHGRNEEKWEWDEVNYRWQRNWS
jgi:hypothetical protein